MFNVSSAKHSVQPSIRVSENEVEAISGIQVTEVYWMFDPAICGYGPVNDRDVILVTHAFTDVTLKKLGESYTATELYEINKQADLLSQTAVPESFKVEDIDNLGDQAYVFIETDHLVRNQVLKNKILYWFVTGPMANNSIGYDMLLKLAKIALQRAP